MKYQNQQQLKHLRATLQKKMTVVHVMMTVTVG